MKTQYLKITMCVLCILGGTIVSNAQKKASGKKAPKTTIINTTREINHETTPATQESSFKRCNVTFASKKGKVLPGGPTKIKSLANSLGPIEVIVNKTSGRAAALVTTRQKGELINSFNFPKGNNAPMTKREEFETKSTNRFVEVKITNNSATNTFGYTAWVVGETSDLITGDSGKSFNLQRGESKEVFTFPSCTGKFKVIVRKRDNTTGKATVNFAKKLNNGTWQKMPTESAFINTGDTEAQIYEITTSKKLRITITNTSDHSAQELFIVSVSPG